MPPSRASSRKLSERSDGQTAQRLCDRLPALQSHRASVSVAQQGHQTNVLQRFRFGFAQVPARAGLELSLAVGVSQHPCGQVVQCPVAGVDAGADAVFTAGLAQQGCAGLFYCFVAN